MHRLLPMMLCSTVLLGCASRQTLTSPCLAGAAASDPKACPACAAAADCYVLSNPCHASASCVPRAGNWAVTLEGCSVEHEVPPASECVCTNQVCQAAAR